MISSHITGAEYEAMLREIVAYGEKVLSFEWKPIYSMADGKCCPEYASFYSCIIVTVLFCPCMYIAHSSPPPLQTGDDAILNAVHAVWPGIDHGVYGRSEWRYFLPTVNDNGFHCD